MAKERFKIVPTSFLVFLEGRRILLLRRFNTGHEDGNYSLVGGHLDGDETFLQAAVREAEEEAGIMISIADLEVVHVMHRKCQAEERIDFYIHAKKWEGEPRIMEPHKCDELKWFDLGNLPENTIPYIRQAIGCITNKEFYSESGW